MRRNEKRLFRIHNYVILVFGQVINPFLIAVGTGRLTITFRFLQTALAGTMVQKYVLP